MRGVHWPDLKFGSWATSLVGPIEYAYTRRPLRITPSKWLKKPTILEHAWALVTGTDLTRLHASDSQTIPRSSGSSARVSQNELDVGDNPRRRVIRRETTASSGLSSDRVGEAR